MLVTWKDGGKLTLWDTADAALIVLDGNRITARNDRHDIITFAQFATEEAATKTFRELVLRVGNHVERYDIDN